MTKDKTTQRDWLSLDEMLKLAEGINEWSFSHSWLNYGLFTGRGNSYAGILEFEPMGDLAIVVGLDEKIKLVGTTMVNGSLKEVTKRENYGFIRAQCLNMMDGRQLLGDYSDEGTFDDETKRFVPDKRLIDLYNKAERHHVRGTYYDERFVQKVMYEIRRKNERFILEQARSLLK